MKNLKLGTVGWMIGISALVLFASSSLRHELFQSTAWDLGIFDQAVYLISQGQTPISSFLGFHILGDHAAWIFYPLALLYKISPSVYWLFAVQAAALALGALPTWYLARQAGLKESQVLAITTTYLLYPLVFNINLFDFHPEVMVLPALLGAVLAAREKHIWWFCFSIILVLGCKAVLSLTVAAMGVWLLFFEKRRLYGVIALIVGLAWFAIATKGIIPFYGTEAASITRHLGRYGYLGSSFSEITKNLLFNPIIILEKLFSLDNLGYLVLLLAPIIWGISLQGMTPLISAIPCLAINLFADYQPQKELLHQYSLPILPFLLLSVISSLAAGRGWLQHKRAIILWSLVAFLSLAKFTYFGERYLESLDTWQATREAISQVQPIGSVLTTDEIAPHLSHRPLIKLIQSNSPSVNLKAFNYILLNIRHHGLSSNQEFDINLLNQLKNQPEFKLQYQRDDVYLFVKT
ncbi:DUF2079 domain-containing protein [Komarekiella sp. 'clone 1']|uniref:DUF2079 domain-containing protein n=1 Tax=Komarekiella delphini-convector SJRDD-AB1 TaxID=2593771 RepID=A0AA40VRW7_9NOST|nr:DUF2079 domain-containing protein [Komarekiella delphini-convector]MBD6617579.1 DUF2079 domain-containing protein [Komarekiella delphini-convector SJRDD-AB1]